MFTETGIIRIMKTECKTKGKLAEYFEHNFLKWQMDHGRMPQSEFAKLLNITGGYLNQLLEGKRTSVAFHTAVYIAELLGDFEILDILGYERPQVSPAISIDHLPEDVQVLLTDFVAEVGEATAGLDSRSVEADEIVRSLMDKYGFNFISKRKAEPGNEKQ